MDTTLDIYDIFFKNRLSGSEEYREPSNTKYPIDIYTDDTGAYFEIPCSGIPKDDIKISVDNTHLNIKYERRPDEKIKERKYLRKGIARRSFDLDYKFTNRFDLDKVKAKFDNGILTINVPYSKTAKPKVIKIQ